MVIAYVDHQVRPRNRRRRGDFRKGPRRRIVAILLRIPVKPTAGVAEHQNTLRVGPCERQHPAVERRCDSARRHRDLAAAHRKCSGLDVLDALPRFGANDHRRRDAVEDHLRAGIVGDRAHARGTVGPEFDPLGKNARLRRRRPQQDRNGATSRHGKAHANGTETVEMKHSPSD
jgi:hypothetical protein